MSKSNWRSVFAAVGLAIFVTSPPQQSSAQQEPNSAKGDTNAGSPSVFIVEKANERPKLNEPCEPGDDDRQSDLCAQWKAADAAYEAALWNGRAYWLGVAGLVVGIVTFASAFAAARYAKRAAEEAKRTADEASAANALAQKSHIESERAWITTEIIFEADTRVTDDALSLEISIWNTNIGRTPALDVSSNIRIVNAIDPAAPKRILEEMCKTSLRDRGEDGVVVVPQQKYKRRWFPTIDGPDEGFTNSYVIGCITYGIIGIEERKQNAFCFILMTTMPNGIEEWGLIPIDGAIHAKRIRLNPWNGGFAT